MNQTKEFSANLNEMKQPARIQFGHLLLRSKKRKKRISDKLSSNFIPKKLKIMNENQIYYCDICDKIFNIKSRTKLINPKIHLHKRRIWHLY